MIGPTFADEIRVAGLSGLPFTWGVDGVQFDPSMTVEQIVAVHAVLAAHDPQKPLVPDSVLMSQARLSLFGAGLLATIDALIDGMPSPQKEAARIQWEYAQRVKRDNPLVLLLGQLLGLSSEQLDALFIEASTL